MRTEDYLVLLMNDIAILGNVPQLNKLVCSGELDYYDGEYRKNWKTEYWHRPGRRLFLKEENNGRKTGACRTDISMAATI